MEAMSTFLMKLPSTTNVNIDMSKLKSTEATLAAAGILGTLGAIQTFTDWDPIGRCFTFWKQLRVHVSTYAFNFCPIFATSVPQGLIDHSPSLTYSNRYLQPFRRNACPVQEVLAKVLMDT